MDKRITRKAPARRLACLALMLAASTAACAQVPYVSQVWNPDRGDGIYTNPVINADYSDPDVIAVGDDYYLTASSFQCVPGLPVLHSKDLVNWKIIGHALKSLYTGDSRVGSYFSQVRHGEGVWAPSIRYHDGEFFIYWGDPDFGVYMVKTRNPAGPWSDPLCVIEGKGMIDTCPLWDEDGRCYLVNGWANSRARFASVLTVRELSADGTRAISNPVIVFDGNGTENRTCEGPKFYKRDGWYWIFCPAGGVPTGFQLAMRSRSPYGPYEAKVVLAQGKTAVNGPHQGGWVHTTQGEDWFIHFQDKEAYGRVCHLQPVTWKDNWPVMGKVPAKGYCGEPVDTYRKPKTAAYAPAVNPQESDEFDTTAMGLQWQWQANYDQTFGMPTPWGIFRLYCNHPAGRRIWNLPNLLLQKTPADSFTATAKVRMTAKAENQYGGIIVMGLDYSALVVRRVGQAFQLQRITCEKADKGSPERVDVIATLKPTGVDAIDYQPAIHEDIWLRIVVADSRADFLYSTDGRHYRPAGIRFAMREGKWIGAKIGLVAVQEEGNESRGWLDADWFRVTK